VGSCGLDASDSGGETVAYCFEHCNEGFSSIKCG
jgi:hypothetical protein